MMRSVAILGSAAMVASLFLAWASLPMGTTPSPWDAFGTFRETGVAVQDAARTLWSEAPMAAVGLALYLGSVGLAALLVLTGLLGGYPRLMRLIVGLMAVALGVGLYLEVSGQVTALNEAFGTGQGLGVDWQMLWDGARQVLGPGAWAYFGGALVVLLAGLFDFG